MKSSGDLTAHAGPVSTYRYAAQPASSNGNRVEKFLTAFAAILRHTNYSILLDFYARVESSCACCPVSCQINRASNDPRLVPCYRTNLLLDVYRRHFTLSGWLQNQFLNRTPLTEEKIDELAELVYHCNTCHRCKFECPQGIDHGLMTRLGRYILSEIGIVPEGLARLVRDQIDKQNSRTPAARLASLKSLEQKLQETTGVSIPIPVDREGAEYIFFPAVNDYTTEAETLMGAVAVLHAAGINWTVSSKYYDGFNYGLFYNDWLLEQITTLMIAEGTRLNAKKILIGECGHAARSAKQFVPTFAQNGSPPPVTNILELTWQMVKKGKIELKPEAVTGRVTYHDPCNIARSGWLVKQPRRILRSFVKDFVEMQPHGADTYCCGGGGGLVFLDETQDFRMQVAGKIKAEQIKATGADIVATSCAECKKQLREIVDYYRLPVKVAGVHDLVLQAIKL